VGAAMLGSKPVIVHQRLDFGFIALDQIVNNAASWHYTFAGQSKIPVVMRFVIGRGWGNGPQHSQSSQALYAHIPGLKVVMPTTPYDAKGLLIQSIKDNNPVIFIEHRWLHGIKSHVPSEPYTVPIGIPKVVREGNDITIASTSYMTIEAIRAADNLKSIGISAEVIDIRTLKPLDTSQIRESVRKTGRLLVMDTGWRTCGFAGEIVADIAESCFNFMKDAPMRLTLPDIPTPTSYSLTKTYYPDYTDAIMLVAKSLGKQKEAERLISQVKKPTHHDVPDTSFRGPF